MREQEPIIMGAQGMREEGKALDCKKGFNNISKYMHAYV